MGTRRDRSVGREDARRPAEDLFAIAETLRRAEAAIRTGRDAEAGRLLRGVLAAHPHRGDAALLLGITERRRGRIAEAEALFRKVLAQRSRCSAVLIELGECALLDRRPAEACLWFWRAVAVDTRNAWACGRLGDALAALDRPVDAEACRVVACAVAEDRNRSWRGGAWLGAGVRAAGEVR